MPITNTINTPNVGTTASTASGCTHIRIKQGDSYNLYVTLYAAEMQNNEEVLTAYTSADLPLLDKIVFNIGKFVRHEVDAAEAFDSTKGAFAFHIDQSDTLMLRPGVYKFDCRVKFASEDVAGIREQDGDGADTRIFIHVIDGEDREVI